MPPAICTFPTFLSTRFDNLTCTRTYHARNSPRGSESSEMPVWTVSPVSSEALARWVENQMRPCKSFSISNLHRAVRVLCVCFVEWWAVAKVLHSPDFPRDADDLIAITRRELHLTFATVNFATGAFDITKGQKSCCHDDTLQRRMRSTASSSRTVPLSPVGQFGAPLP